MSIQNLIRRHCENGSLRYLRPLVASDPINRPMFLTNCVKEFLDGPWTDVDSEVRGNQLRSDLEVFVTGGLVRVSNLARKKPPNTYMAPTHPRTDEIFSIRSTNPRPQIRVFGAFSEIDHFVVLNYAYRDEIDWTAEIEVAAKTWRDLFGTFARHSGAFPDDYISENKIVVR